MMQPAGGRTHDIIKPAADGPEAQVDVVVGDGKCLVEAAEGIEFRSLDHQAGTGHGDPVVFQQVAHEISGGVRRLLQEGMHRSVCQVQNAGMLHQVRTGIEQLRSHRADMRKLGVAGHALQPVRRQQFRVVIQEQQRVALCLGRPQIAQFGVVERHLMADNVMAVLPGQALQQVQCCGVRRTIVDDDRLEPLPGSDGVQRLDAAPQDCAVVPCRDDNGHQRFIAW